MVQIIYELELIGSVFGSLPACVSSKFGPVSCQRCNSILVYFAPHILVAQLQAPPNVAHHHM